MNGYGFHREDLRFYGKHNDNFFRSFTGCFPSLLVAYKEWEVDSPENSQLPNINKAAITSSDRGQ